MPPQNLQEQIEKELAQSGALEDKKPSDEKGSAVPNGPSPFDEPEKKYTPNPLLKTLRTYQGDIEETIEKKKESITSIVTAEQKKADLPTQVEKKPVIIPRERSSSIFLTFGVLPLAGIILFILGITTLGGIYYYSYLHNAPIPVAVNTTIIPYTDTIDIDINASASSIGEQIAESFSNQIKVFNQQVGSVLYLHFTENKSDLGENDFFQSIAPDAPPALGRSFNTDYMAGIYSFDQNEPFILMTSDDYGETYAGMLTWESLMKNDLQTLFPDLKNSSFGSSTPAFTDETYGNKDVRVLRNDDGDIVLLYGFLDKKTLIITANEKIFTGVLNKYINTKLVH